MTRRVYTCGRCGRQGHQARSCLYAPGKPDRMPALEGQQALRTMVPEVVAIEAVMLGTENIQTAILKAIEAEDASPFPVSRSLSNAWRELLARSRDVPEERIREAQRARRALAKAQGAWQAAIRPIRSALYPDSENVPQGSDTGSEDSEAQGSLLGSLLEAEEP